MPILMLTRKKLIDLDEEVLSYMKQNSGLEENIVKWIYQRTRRVLTGAREKLSKLNNLRGKLSQKVSTITKEHKFFTENTECPYLSADHRRRV